jgi:hypothetical protein
MAIIQCAFEIEESNMKSFQNGYQIVRKQRNSTSSRTNDEFQNE